MPAEVEVLHVLQYTASMDICLEPGHYTLAVSGGVDSVVLLDVLSRQPQLQLTVAHFDHGIRPDSAADATFVQGLAQRYGLPFISDRAELGPGASEAVARQARYDFLQCVADGSIVTAHHLDDWLETAIINIIRGSGRRGLTSLQSTTALQRPLLRIPKAEILYYARQHSLQWREDATNQDAKYTRNYVRHVLLPKFSDMDRQKLQEILYSVATLNPQIDQLVTTTYYAIKNDQNRLCRRQFIMLPHSVAKEVMAAWLRQQGFTKIDSKLLERLVRAAKTQRPGTYAAATKNYQLNISLHHLALQPIER